MLHEAMVERLRQELDALGGKTEGQVRGLKVLVERQMRQNTETQEAVRGLHHLQLHLNLYSILN